MTQEPHTDHPRIAALIVAAGRGLRAGGGLAKQWRALAGKTVAQWTVDAFDTHPAVGQIVLVVADDAPPDALPMAQTTPLRSVTGGATRAASVAAGLQALDGLADLVLIHDVARPGVPAAVIDAVIAALDDHPGAAPALAVTDALWRGDGLVEGTLARDGLWRAQTPQGFHLSAILAAHETFAGDPTDDVQVARAAGMEVAIVPGHEDNLKITTPGDFARAAQILEKTQMDIRTGNGFDVHRFGPGDHVMLCGVAVPHDRGLQGHSDADVGLHTLTDAIYGALAEGDIGTHFPPSDPQWKGAESHIFLTHAVERVAARGFAITHADVTLICERPKIGPQAATMRARLAELLRIEVGRISVKATTTERLGFTGREEGIAALATVTLVKT
ncbi:bifunctional 2-C-methyl-D-erythritol 4-phosphate cytidylyltransferase/2-C-methyl-D-erythritol 2,4-cyclodiphosphate synthase [Roseicyclus marinus]|uniref:bifunctional 2-C-methyl-D-erythritol 4-phosphate cytidylyltransferase/2-C-methyl-D-erythritol 2,4-cyclodiphosphate synthase n=1 Tax=Roseicyclus marinus TaxID=2161673 RepID=UPI00241047D5|nr:bifunctional 2-C-methyl-D-erythritol 4-phosphate cytidylyltransferase/2-C-methyl-D-erythritol 2,4-cyclodiphosphate synthase [Roseicyclus marinus]MDG3042723.1 bifunctional 2-C-methyl-D-erythritol 4-phosphate cytidylyltransferase/2-C-methyl-D-erythritol 2,4-cyclodiphosphate synthase [Roseicyclus marinus]